MGWGRVCGIFLAFRDILVFFSMGNNIHLLFETKIKSLRSTILYLPVYKSTFYSLKISPKNHPQLIHGSSTEIKKSSGQMFCLTIAYLEENYKIKDKFFKKILTQQNKKNLFFGSKTRGQLIHG